MIPSEVADIATLIFAHWATAEPEAQSEILDAAWRIYKAGYRRSL